MERLREISKENPKNPMVDAAKAAIEDFFTV